MNGRLLKTMLPTMILLFGALKGHAAGPVFWDWRGADDLATVRLNGTALDESGALVRGLVATPVGPDGPEVIWCLEADGEGGFYSGSGHDGDIHHTDRNGEVRLVASVPATEVFSLLLPTVGGLLAGCGPDGQIYRLSEDGTPLELGRVPGGYVWDLLPDPDDDTVWLATGSPAAVWRLEPDGNLVEHATLDAQNVLDLALDATGKLLAATQGPGLVYRLDRRGERAPEVLFEAAQNEVRQFVTGPDGAVHVLALHVDELPPANPEARATASMLQVLNGHQENQVPRSALYRLEADGLVRSVWTGDQDVMIAAWSPAWGWLAGAVLDEANDAARLLGLVPPAGTRAVAGWTGGDVLALLVTDDRIVAAQAHPGRVTALGTGEGDHLAQGRPVDAGRPVRWGRLRWNGVGDLGGVRWSVRGGNRALPDVTWTDWSREWGDQDRALDLPPSRFLQWRVRLPGEGDIRVTTVSLSAWQDNLPPSIAEFREEQVGQVQDGGLMPRGENVTQTMRSGLKVEFGRPSQRDRRTPPDRADRIRPVRTFSWSGDDPDGDRVVWRLEYRREDAEAWRPIVADTPENVGSWDTTDLPDGVYRVRLTASDAPDNPEDLAGRSQRELGPLRVDNSPPRLADVRLQRSEQGLRVRCRAEDRAGVIGAAAVVLPDGSRQRLDPVDGICDSEREDFDRDIPWPPGDRPGGIEPWRLRLEVRDLAGNLAVSEGEVR